MRSSPAGTIRKYTYRDGKFRSHRNIISKFFSLFRLDGIGKPLRDAELARQELQRSIDEIAPDVEVQALVVFVDPSAKINFEDELDTPVLFADTSLSPEPEGLHARCQTPARGRSGRRKKRQPDAAF